MFETYEFSARVPRVRVNRLSMCLMAVLASQMSAGAALAASPNAALPRAAAEHRGVPAKGNPDHPAAQPWTVQNCTDHDTNSLRDIIENNKAQSGDTVDLSQLPALCGSSDSKITLTSGEIVIAQNDLTLQGPDPVDGIVTISGGGASRVLKHLGTGTLAFDSLTISEGLNHVAGDSKGGCIESDNGSLYLRRTAVTGCTAASDTGLAMGGGIYSHHDVAIVLSTISGNHANGSRSYGGGIRAGTLTAKYSAISSNTAIAALIGRGGGAQTYYGISAFASTIDDNTASTDAGGLHPIGSAIILNSTISGNVASSASALQLQGDATISNSTIAFNHSNDYWQAIVLQGAANTTLTLQSSIVAKNTMTDGNTPGDIFVAAGVLSGADNLVIASNVSDPTVITVTADPKLGPLQFNGGPTRTHALLPGSPAIGVGNANGLLPGMSNDQRGHGYPRTTGPMQTVDMGAFQFDSIFADAFDLQ